MSSSPVKGTTLKPMPGTYTAVEVSAPRELRVVERRVAEPGPATGDATLRFSALSGVSAMIETVPLEQAAEAYARMMEGKARFRIVLVTKDGISRLP